MMWEKVMILRIRRHRVSIQRRRAVGHNTACCMTDRFRMIMAKDICSEQRTKTTRLKGNIRPFNGDEGRSSRQPSP